MAVTKHYQSINPNFSVEKIQLKNALENLIVS